MKTLILPIILLLIIVACDKKGKESLEINITSKTVLIDVRTKSEFDSGHLENAINIQYNEIEKKIITLTKNKDKSIVVYCRSGRRSGIAKKMLGKIGYKNVINGGSYTELKKQVPKR